MMTANGGTASGVGSSQMFESDHIAGVGKKEPANVANARARSGSASQPSGGKVTKESGK